MAGFGGIAAAGKSIERLLAAWFVEEEPVPSGPTQAILVRTDDFAIAAGGSTIRFPSLSIWVYRVDFNKTMRAAWSAAGHMDGGSHLPLDVHFLITAWANNAEDEHRIIGRAMQRLESLPILSGPLLHTSTDWAPNEAIQIVLEDVSTEAVMRTFDSLQTDYRLSIPYIARIVRIDGPGTDGGGPVTTVATGIRPHVEDRT